MIKVINFILLLMVVLLSLIVDYYFLIIVFLYGLSMNLLLNIGNNREYKDISFFVFLFVGVFSLINCSLYQNLYDNTFGPYFDDSFYYFNSITLSELSIGLPPTLFELFLAIPQFLSKSIFDVYIPHLYLLPVNWFLSSFSIVILLKILNLFFSVTLKQQIISTLSVILNYNFIDTAAHLYRDIFLLFFSLLFIYNMIKKNHKLMFLFGIFVFFIRGANGILLLILYGIYYLIGQKNFSIKKIILISIIPFMLIYYYSDSISSSFFRGGFGVEETYSLQERISNRLEYNQTEGDGGSMVLRRGNIILKSIYPIVYSFSPFFVKTQQSYITVRHSSESNLLGYTVGTYSFPAWYKLPFYIHILSISFFLIMIIQGVIFSLKKDYRVKFSWLGLFMIIQILAISIISMQARHRLPIIILFPIFYSIAYPINIKKKVYYFSTITLLGIILLINIIYNL